MFCIEGLATIPQVGLPINVTLSMDEAAKAKYSWQDKPDANKTHE